MSLFTSVEVVPSRLRAVWQFLRAHGPADRPRVEAFLYPDPSSKRGEEITKDVLRQGTALSLFEKTGDNYQVPKERDSRDDFDSVMRDLLFEPNRDVSADLLKNLAMMIHSSKTDRPLSRDTFVGSMTPEQCSSLFYYARWLGVGHGDLSSFTVDPTPLLREVLTSLEMQGSVRFSKVMDQLTTRVPFLESGSVYQLYLKTANESERPRVLGAATSNAFLRLEEERFLTLQSGHDAEENWHVGGEKYMSVEFNGVSA